MLLLTLLLACQPASVGTPGRTIPDDEPHEPEPQGPAVTPWDEGRVYEIALTLAPEDWEALRLQERNIIAELTGDCQAEPFESPYSWFVGDVEIDGERFEQVEIRKKGLAGSASTTKPGLRLDLDDHVEGQAYLGAEHLTLNNGVQDPSLVHQCLAYGLFRSAGYPAPRCAFATVSVNGEPLGVYVTVEPVRVAFLEDRFGDASGALFEGTLSDFREGWTGTFDPDTDAAETDRSVIDSLVAALAEDDAVAALEPVLDLDLFETFRALEALAGHWDGYTGNTNNYFVYQRPDDGRAVFLPWGADAAFERVDWFGDGQGHVFTNAALPLALHREAAASYEARLVELLDTAWDGAALHDAIDLWEERLAPHVGGDDRWWDGLAAVRDFVEDQPGALLDELEAGGADLSGRVLRDSPCLVERGTVSATLSTTYGSTGAADLWTAGEAELTVTWDGTALPLVATSAISGPIDGIEPDETFLAALGALDDTTLLLPYLVLPVEDLVTGRVLPIDWLEVEGTLGYASGGNDLAAAAYLYGGELTVVQGGTTAGDAVEVRFESTLWGGQE